jgi:hypothetical protein
VIALLTEAAILFRSHRLLAWDGVHVVAVRTEAGVAR